MKLAFQTRKVLGGLMFGFCVCVQVCIRSVFPQLWWKWLVLGEWKCDEGDREGVLCGGQRNVLWNLVKGAENWRIIAQKTSLSSSTSFRCVCVYLSSVFRCIWPRQFAFRVFLQFLHVILQFICPFNKNDTTNMYIYMCIYLSVSFPSITSFKSLSIRHCC